MYGSFSRDEIADPKFGLVCSDWRSLVIRLVAASNASQMHAVTVTACSPRLPDDRRNLIHFTFCPPSRRRRLTHKYRTVVGRRRCESLPLVRPTVRPSDRYGRHHHHVALFIGHYTQTWNPQAQSASKEGNDPTTRQADGRGIWITKEQQATGLSRCSMPFYSFCVLSKARIPTV